MNKEIKRFCLRAKVRTAIPFPAAIAVLGKVSLRLALTPALSLKERGRRRPSVTESGVFVKVINVPEVVVNIKSL